MFLFYIPLLLEGMLYVSLLIQKSYLCSDITFQSYQSAFHSGHFLTIHLIIVVYLFRYSVFYDRGTSN